jgi:hypothetical protein
MLRRFMKKRVLIALTVVGVLAVAGGAYAYFTSTGSANATATVGSAGSWGVTDSTVAATLYPGQGSEAVKGTVTNNGSGNQQLNTITVTINAPTVAAGAPVVSGHPCSATDFALSTTTGSGWTVAGNGQSATYSPNQDLAPNGTFNFSGLSLSMVDQTYDQGNCQGATAKYSEAAS